MVRANHDKGMTHHDFAINIDQEEFQTLGKMRQEHRCNRAEYSNLAWLKFELYWLDLHCQSSQLQTEFSNAHQTIKPLNHQTLMADRPHKRARRQISEDSSESLEGEQKSTYHRASDSQAKPEGSSRAGWAVPSPSARAPGTNSLGQIQTSWDSCIQITISHSFLFALDRCVCPCAKFCKQDSSWKEDSQSWWDLLCLTST